MKRHSNLFDKIIETQNLYLSAKKAFRGKKLKPTVAPFYFNLENEILDIQRSLKEGSYQPLPYKLFKIYEPKERNICFAEFKDRVAHHAIMNVLEPVFERRLISGAYACRVGKGTYKALKKSQSLVRKYNYYLKADIRKCFESIDHYLLKILMRKIFKDKKLLSLLDVIISHQPPYTETGKGLPIGNLTSQHFANVYLGELDLFVKHKLKAKGYIRYMDDFILFSNDKNQLNVFLKRVRAFLSEKLQLELKEKATRISPVSEGLVFLGYRVFRGLVRLQRARLVRFRRKMAKLEKKHIKGKIREEDLINSMRSVIAHVSHGNTRNVRNKVFLR
ncbi:MAG: reverse transcriptase/maturase family protein [Oligoflexia bacterium]|nr:reverse transcriptase/maturase family protein [Oligoflexia bacterium]